MINDPFSNVLMSSSFVRGIAELGIVFFFFLIEKIFDTTLLLYFWGIISLTNPIILITRD